MGRSIDIEQVPFEKMVDMYGKFLFGERNDVDQRFQDALERLLLYYNKRGIVGNPGVLEWLLGRPGDDSSSTGDAATEEVRIGC